MSAFIAIGSYSAAAYAEVTDLGTLEPGKEYSWPQYSTVTAKYIPAQTGPVKFVYSTTPLELFTSADHAEGTSVFGSHAYTDNGQVMSYQELQAGTTYYVYHPFAMDAGTLTIYEGSSELKLTSTNPSIDPESPEYYGGKLSASAVYEMNVNFNFPVTIGNVYLIAPDNSRVSVSSKAYGTSVACEVGPALMSMYHDGTIKEGDEVILRLFSVADATDSSNKFDGSGRCEVKFTVAAKPLELVEVIGAKYNSVDNAMNSYYLPGDENGMIKFVFDGPLSSDKMSVASIEYGNSDNLEVGMYYENIEATHDGATATFDFTGKRRRPIDMLPNSDSTTQPESIYVSCGNIFSPDGQRAYTGSKSNPTGYPMSFVINVLQYTVVGDFTPARGTELVFGTPMEIWVMNGDKIKYDAIRFDYKENGEDKFYDIPAEKVAATPDEFSEGAVLYNFTIPTLNCDLDSEVIVSMNGLECADGLDHSNDIRGEFKAKVSGIEDVTFAGSETFDVYDIAGVRVLSGVKADALSALAKGIYVINGKKVVIR